MKNNKNIDRLFQERFKDFETEPNNQTWSTIQARLNDQKKERKIIPFWFKLAGIAAAFIVGFFALNTFFSTTIIPENKIVLDPAAIKSSIDTSGSASESLKDNIKSTSIQKNSIIVVNQTKNLEKDEKETATTLQEKIIYGKKTNQASATIYFGKNNPSLGTVTATKLEGKINTLNSENSEKILDQNSENILGNKKGNLATAKTEFNELKTSNEELPNELETILKLKEKKDINVVAEKKSKWEITPNISAMYPNAKVANLDPQFSENAKSTENSIGFGIGVNYAVSKRVTIRSGINKFTLGFNTNNVTYSPGLKNTYLANVSYTTNAMIEVNNAASANSLMTFEKDLQKTNTGTINQKMGYYEVPLEISYIILNKKLGISVIGGISTLFLDENKISLISPETNLKLGEANNLNTVNFSSNIGLGFKYKFVKSFQLNFEPVIKYQLNTFSNNSGNTKPLIIGLYSGISYHF
ncbi:hypothetical protein [Flavobacterium weaverense]|uniref:Outer membrane protein with beta-barrel domain n=1 Tax=Flavobacterium weaverense TaxID=271156 RepID=A0A3M0A2R8_9FLAO|nr:hypothetical protein [Flavobacterium weaverense]RMA76998.1 hypothetical protein BC961_0979 [Flavobacterium weaverense]